MTDDYREVSLSEVVTRVTTKNADRINENVLTVSAERGLIPQESFFTKKVSSKDTSGYYIVKPGQFVYNKSTSKSAAYGTVARNLSDEPGIVSPLYFVFEAKDGVALPEYLELALNSDQFFGSLAGTLREGARAHGLLNVRLKEFYAATVTLPPTATQKRIVEVIGAVDDQITALEAEVEAVVKVRTGLVGRSADTRQVPLGSLGVVSQGKGLPKQYQGKRTGEVSWYKIADMTGPGNEFGYTLADTRLTPSEVAEIGGVVVEAGTVTFPRVGAAVLTEKKRIVDTPGALDENHLAITPGEETNSEYLLAAMEGFRLSSLVRSGAVPSLNMGLIRTTKVPWSWTENQSLGTALGALRAKSRVLAAEAASLRTIRAVLLSGLLDRTIDIKFAELEI